jgi:hypothetical protein
MEGAVNLQLSSKTFGIFEAIYNSVKVSITYANMFYEYITYHFVLADSVSAIYG